MRSSKIDITAEGFPSQLAVMLAAMSPHVFQHDPHGPRCLLYARALTAACSCGGIGTDLGLFNFLGQIAEETGGYCSLVESTAYGAKQAGFLAAHFSNVHGITHAQRLIAEGPVAIANTIYAGKNGNGDPASGDGWRFRGRGFLQITGRGNYRKIGKAIDMDLEGQPEQLGNPGPAAEAAGRFWRLNNINLAADLDEIATVTRLVNGHALLGLQQRTEWRNAAEKAWATKPGPAVFRPPPENLAD